MQQRPGWSVHPGRYCSAHARDAPSPPDIQPVRFETQLRDLHTAVVVESEDDSLTVLEVQDRNASKCSVRVTRPTSLTSEFLQAMVRLENVAAELDVGELPTGPPREVTRRQGQQVWRITTSCGLLCPKSTQHFLVPRILHTWKHPPT